MVSVWKSGYDLVDKTTICSGQFHVVPPQEYHQFEALEDTIAFELYWGEFNPNDIGTPTTTIFFQNDLGDPSHLPINIGEMSPEAFEYFRRRVNGNNNVASGGVNYDLYNYLHKRYGIGAANWYENNPTKPHGSNPNIPTPEAPYVPLASNSMTVDILM